MFGDIRAGTLETYRGTTGKLFREYVIRLKHRLGTVYKLNSSKLYVVGTMSNVLPNQPFGYPCKPYELISYRVPVVSRLIMSRFCRWFGLAKVQLLEGSIHR
jgi:hypothetical protein